MEITVNGKSRVVWSETNCTTGKITKACKAALQPVLRQLQ